MLELWNASSGTLVSSLHTTANYALCSVVFSPNGKLLADGGVDGSSSSGVVELWNVSSNSLAQSLSTEENGGVRSVAFSQDGSALAVAGQSYNPITSGFRNLTEIWNAMSGNLLKTLNTQTSSCIEAVALSHDGRKLAVGGYTLDSYSGTQTGLLQIWDPATGTPIGAFKTAAQYQVSSVAFSPDGTLLAVGGYSFNPNTSVGAGVLEIWGVASNTLIKSLPTGAGSQVTSVQFSPDGKTLCDCGVVDWMSGVLELWNVSSGTLLTTLNTNANPSIDAVAYTPDGQTIAAVVEQSDGVDIELWNVSTLALTRTIGLGAFPSPQSRFSLAFSPDGLKVACGGSITTVSGGPNGIVGLWKVSTGQQVAFLSLAPGTSYVNSVSFSPDGKVLFAGTSGSILQAFSMSNYSFLCEYPAYTAGDVEAVAVSPNGSSLALRTSSGVVEYAVNPYSTVAVSSLAMNPSEIAAGTSSTGTVTLASAAPPGGDVVMLASGDSSVLVPAYVVVKSGATSATFMAITSASANDLTTTISATSGGVTASASLKVIDVTLSSLQLDPAFVAGGNPSTATVTLAVAAPPAGFTMSFVSSSAVAKVQPTVTVPAGATSAAFTVTTVPVDSQTNATISTGSGSSTFWSTLTIMPATVGSLVLVPSTVGVGGTSTGSLTLTGPAGPSGVVVSLSSNNNLVTVPNTVSIAAGQTSGSFTIKVAAVSVPGQSTSTIVASLNSQSQSAILTFGPTSVSAITVNPSSIVGGRAATGTVTLTGPAGSGGFTVLLSSKNSAAKVPGSLKFGPGQSK